MSVARPHAILETLACCLLDIKKRGGPYQKEYGNTDLEMVET